jgi:hypothetical protein
MGNVFTGLSMSLDGFIAGPSDSPEGPLGEAGERMFVWYYGGDTDRGGGAHRRSDEPKIDLPTGLGKPARRALEAAGYARLLRASSRGQATATLLLVPGSGRAATSRR